MGKCNRCSKDPAAEIHTCSPTQEYRYNLLIKFVKDSSLDPCSLLIPGVNCLPCRARDILIDLGELDQALESKKL